MDNLAFNLNNKNIDNIESIEISKNSNGKVKSYFKDNIWDFTEEDFRQQQRQQFFYKLDFNFKLENKKRFTEYQFRNLLNSTKSFLYLTFQELSFLTMREYFYEMKKFNIFLINKGINSFSSLNEYIFLSYRQHLLIKYENKPHMIRKAFVVIKSLIEKRKLVYDCFQEKYFLDMSISDISLQTKRNTKQVEAIEDIELKEIISQCNELINSAEENIKFITEFKNIRKNYSGIQKLNKNIVTHCNLKLKRKHPNAPNWADLVKFENHLTAACFIIIAAYTGMRVSEILNIPLDCLKKKDTVCGKETYTIYYLKSTTFKYSEDSLGIKNTNDMRSEWLANGEVKNAIDILLTLKQFNIKESNLDTLFTTLYQWNVVPINDESIRRWIKEFLKSSIHPHQFRRTFARLVARSAFSDVDILKEHFKHKTKEITEYYMRGDVDKEFYSLIKKDSDHIKNTIDWNSMLDQMNKELGKNYKLKED